MKYENEIQEDEILIESTVNKTLHLNLQAAVE